MNFKCTECGKDFKPLNKGQLNRYKNTGRIYCSKECSSKYKARISSLTMSRTNKKYASKRMKENNPMKNPKIREKARLTLIAKGHKPKQIGGNGRGLTKSQAILSAALGWDCEYIIKTGSLKDKYSAPYHYKIDIANPELKIAIEVDGKTHNNIKGKDRDSRKDAFLKEIGWKVLRFKNEEVINNLSECLDVIRKAI